MRVLLVFLSGLLLFTSCSVLKKEKVEESNYILYPSAPDTSRIQFLTSISSSVQLQKTNKFKEFIFGETKPIEIGSPYGVFMNKGKIYAASPAANCIYIIELDRGIEIFSPTGKGSFRSPSNCFVDIDGKMYVSDVARRQVLVFDEGGKFLKSIGGAELRGPTDVFVQDEIFVCDMSSHKIYIYDKESFELIKSFPDAELGDEAYLYSPSNITLSDETVFVSDMGSSKMYKFTTEGKFIESFGGVGDRLGQFTRPKGIAVDEESNLFVVDAAFENVQIFNKENKLLMFFGGPYRGPGDMYLPAKVHVNYDNNEYFYKYVDPEFELQYLILVSNQFGPDKINVYGAIKPKE